MTSSYYENMVRVRNNPALQLAVAYTELEAQLAGKGTYDVPNAGHPFPFALEHGTMASRVAVDSHESVLRRAYPSMAQTINDLYFNMYDDAYLGRFSTPALTYFEHLIPKDEILAKVVPYGEDGLKKLIIPGKTAITIADTSFTFQYPIEIRQMRHGGLSIVYDLSAPSPVQTLESNVVEAKELNIGGRVFVYLRTPVYQIKLSTFQDSMNPATAFSASYPFVDQFYFARIYVSDATQVSGWREIKTTHSDQVFNPSELTAVLKVNGNNLDIQLPLVYNTQGLVNGEIRVDIYSTKGEIDLDLGSYAADQFHVDFNAIDDDLTYVSPLTTFSTYMVLNPNRVTGGSNALTFAELRDAVIDNTMSTSDIPITNAQIAATVERSGYSLVTNVNNITKRQFLAARRLPAPSNGSTISGAGCRMSQLTLNMAQIAASQNVKDNGNRITILPSMLYRYLNGVVHPISDAEQDAILSGSSESIARWTVENRSLYSPFHYVLDASGDNFDVRPYYLDNPSVVRKTFVGENDTTQLQASIDSYNITKVDEGYQITVQLTSSDQFKLVDDELVVIQLGYRPIGENQYASVNGTLIGKTDTGERIFRFLVASNYDVDSLGGLYTTNMSMYDAAQVDFSLNMQHDMDFSIIVTDIPTPGFVAGELDAMVQSHLLPNVFMTVVRERLTVQFGYDMTEVWRRNRTVLGPESYKTYAEDVPAYYTENVYKNTTTGQPEITYDGTTIHYTILHHAGDPILNAQGQPVMAHLKGETVLDANGEPELLEPRKVMREFTMFLVDGLYYFATEETSVAYRTEIPMQVVTWLINDIGQLRKRLMEEAEIYLYPITTFGDTTAKVNEDMTATVTIDQALTVTYYMTPAAYSNTAMRPPLANSTKEIVNRALQATTIAQSNTTSQLALNAGDSAVNVSLQGLGGVDNFPVLTVLDSSIQLGLRKKLTVLSNQKLLVEDDININFLRHDPTA